MIIMGLIVLVPLISSVNTVEIFWFSRSVFVMPPIHLHQYILVDFKRHTEEGKLQNSYIYLNKNGMCY